MNEALAATGIFPIGGIRSRAHWLDTWQMADGKHDYAFVHMTLKIGAGRSLESREAVGEMLFALINAGQEQADEKSQVAEQEAQRRVQILPHELIDGETL